MCSVCIVLNNQSKYNLKLQNACIKFKSEICRDLLALNFLLAISLVYDAGQTTRSAIAVSCDQWLYPSMMSVLSTASATAEVQIKANINGVISEGNVKYSEAPREAAKYGNFDYSSPPPKWSVSTAANATAWLYCQIQFARAHWLMQVIR